MSTEIDVGKWMKGRNPMTSLNGEYTALTMADEIRAAMEHMREVAAKELPPACAEMIRRIEVR